MMALPPVVLRLRKRNFVSFSSLLSSLSSSRLNVCDTVPSSFTTILSATLSLAYAVYEDRTGDAAVITAIAIDRALYFKFCILFLVLLFILFLSVSGDSRSQGRRKRLYGNKVSNSFPCNLVNPMRYLIVTAAYIYGQQTKVRSLPSFIYNMKNNTKKRNFLALHF